MVSKNTEIFNKLSLKYGIHRNVIQMVCNHPFIFASRRIADPDDEKSIMFGYLFKLRVKKRLKGKKRELYDAIQKRKENNNQSCNESI